MDIDAWPEQRIDVVAAQFQSLKLKQRANEREIERAGKQSAVWKAECRRTAVHTDTGRTIRTAAGRNTEVVQSVGNAAKCGSSAGRYFRAAHALAVHKMTQICIGKLCEKFRERTVSVFDICQL